MAKANSTRVTSKTAAAAAAAAARTKTTPQLVAPECLTTDRRIAYMIDGDTYGELSLELGAIAHMIQIIRHSLEAEAFVEAVVALNVDLQGATYPLDLDPDSYTTILWDLTQRTRNAKEAVDAAEFVRLPAIAVEELSHD